MRVEGVGSHAGGAFEDGASAIVELSHQILALHRMVDLDDGITLNAAPVWGGTRPNVIPPEAGCEIDLRVNSHRRRRADGRRRILGRTAVTAGCRVTVEGGMNRPPFAENPAIRSLYETGAGDRGPGRLALPKQHRGGGSDGNFTAALGIPTLDGLGCPGAGAHASHEHILWRRPGAAGGADGGAAGDAVNRRSGKPRAMLFNSQVFIVCFLPVVLGLYYWLAASRTARQAVVVLASLAFYALVGRPLRSVARRADRGELAGRAVVRRMACKVDSRARGCP